MTITYQWIEDEETQTFNLKFGKEIIGYAARSPFNDKPYYYSFYLAWDFEKNFNTEKRTKKELLKRSKKWIRNLLIGTKIIF